MQQATETQQQTADAPATRLGSINHLRLTVTDVDRAVRFYDPVLRLMGYELIESDADRVAWAGWSQGGVLHWLILSRAHEPRANVAHDRYSPGFHHVAWNASSREQVDALHRLLRSMDATVLDAPAEYEFEPGYYAVFFADPDGMKLELVHVPGEGSVARWRQFREAGAPTSLRLDLRPALKCGC